MKRFVFEILARLGFWISCEKYLPESSHWDWVLISFIDVCGAGIRGIPTIGFYDKYEQRWRFAERSEYLENDCVISHWHYLPEYRFMIARKSRESLTK